MSGNLNVGYASSVTKHAGSVCYFGLSAPFGLDVLQSENAMSELENLRKRIDDLDSALIRVLAERFKITRDIGYLKATNGIAERDLERERVQLEQIDAQSHEVGLDPRMTRAVFAAIIDQVLKEHRELKEIRPGSQ